MSKGAAADELTEMVRLRDPLRMLARFHGEIRRMLARLDALAEDPKRPDAEQEASALVAFLTGPLAMHDVDEEAELLPRIREVAKRQRGHVVQVQQCMHEHATMEEKIGALLPQLLGVAKRRRFDPERLRADVAALNELLEAHLRMEETVLFPLARRILDAEDLQEIANALIARARMRQQHR